MDDIDRPPKGKPDHPVVCLLAGCNIVHEPHLLDVGGWDMDQTKKSK